jgi:hypothetical protein
MSGAEVGGIEVSHIPPSPLLQFCRGAVPTPGTVMNLKNGDVQNPIDNLVFRGIDGVTHIVFGAAPRYTSLNFGAWVIDGLADDIWSSFS